MQEELNQFQQRGGRPNLYIICEGSAQALRPGVQDEVYRIVYEALINALRHAHARNIEIAVVFRRSSLFFNVRDDGCGFGPNLVVVSNKEHSGLADIRDRAERMGARLSIWSARGCGTEMELRLPGPVAFQA
jgi:signal transduction histidine kinase